MAESTCESVQVHLASRKQLRSTAAEDVRGLRPDEILLEHT